MPGVGLRGMVAIVPSLWKFEPLEAHLLAGGPPIRRVPIPGVTDVVAIWDRDDVKKLFTARPDLVPAGEFQVRILGGFGPESVMMVEGERHMRLRKLLLPPFHGPALESYAAAVEEVTRAEIESWPEGEEYPVHPAMYRIVLEVLLKKVVGVSDPERADRLRALLPKVLEVSALTFLLEGRFPSLSTGTPARVLPWVRARRQAEALLREEVAAHRAAPTEHEDVLGMLMSARDEEGEGLTDEELVDQLITLLVAGHQTTGATLAWCFERITRHPAVLARLTREVRAGDNTYLDAVLKETQRVRPAVEVVFRELAEPMELSGYVVPKGTIVMPLIRLVQESDAYPDADEFVPERWLDGKAPPYAWIPYGGGTRRCVGSAFANLEMRIIVGTVLRRYDLDIAARGPERRARARIFTTIPGRGARVTVRSRRAAAAPVPAEEPAPAALG